MLVHHLDHRVVGGLELLAAVLLGAARRRLEVDPGRLQHPLVLQVALTEERARQRFRVVAAVVLPGRIERRVRVVDVHREQPGAVALLVDEVDRHLGGPGRLVQLRRDVVLLRRRLHQVAERVRLDRQDGVRIDALRPNPVHIVVAARPVVARRVRVLEGAVPVVGADLAAVGGAGEVQLADEPAVVADVGEATGDQPLALGEGRVAVAVERDGARVLAGQERSPARRADRRLAVRAGERRPHRRQSVQVRRAHVRVAARPDSVAAQLVRAVPEDVRPAAGHRSVSHDDLRCTFLGRERPVGRRPAKSNTRRVARARAPNRQVRSSSASGHYSDVPSQVQAHDLRTCARLHQTRRSSFLGMEEVGGLIRRALSESITTWQRAMHPVECSSLQLRLDVCSPRRSSTGPSTTGPAIVQ